jgi:hypothetical protein
MTPAQLIAPTEIETVEPEKELTPEIIAQYHFRILPKAIA